MDLFWIGGLWASAGASGFVFWTLLVRPEWVILSFFWNQNDDCDENFGVPDLSGPALRAARWAFGVIHVALAFVCGAVTMFLLGT